MIDIKQNLENAIKKLEKSKHLETIVLSLKIVRKMFQLCPEVADFHFTLMDKIGTLI